MIVTRAGRTARIPSSVIAKDTLYNYATGHVRDDITVGISYGVPPNHVREVVLTLLHDVSQVLREPSPEVLVSGYGDFAIQYSIRYWISDYGAQERVRDRVASGPLLCTPAALDRDPFPTRTVHVRDAGRDEDDKADAGFERELMTDLRQVDWLRGLSDDELRLLVPTIAVASLAQVRCWCARTSKATRCSFCAVEKPKYSVILPTARSGTLPKLPAAISPVKWR